MDNVEPGQSPISSYEQPAPQLPPEQPEGRSFHVSKKLVIIVGLVIMMIISSLVLKNFLSSKPKTTATSKDILLATVGDQKIYKSNVITLAGETYTPKSINSDVIKKVLNIAIERAILEKKAKELNIEVTQAEILKEAGSPTKATSFKNELTYKILKNKIIEQIIQYKDAYYIGFWLPPFNYDVPLPPEKQQIVASQRIDGKKLLDEAEVRIKSGENTLAIAKSLIVKYPTMKPILSVNGYIYNEKLSEIKLNQPVRFTYDLEKADQPFYEALYSMKKAEIKRTDYTDGSGGDIIYVVNTNDSKYPNYDSWFNEQKKELVTLYEK